MESAEYIKTIGKIILDDIEKCPKEVTASRLRVFLNRILKDAVLMERSKNYFESIVNNREFAKAIDKN